MINDMHKKEGVSGYMLPPRRYYLRPDFCYTFTSSLIILVTCWIA
jgi:hypothetical protein